MNLGDLIESNKKGLTANQLKVADFVLTNPFPVATMGIEELAKATDTSAATITRFVRALGLNSYIDFRGMAIQGYQSLLQPVDSIDRARHLPPLRVAEESLNNSVQLAKQVAEATDSAIFQTLATRFLDAPRVAFLGFGVSSIMLQYLADKTTLFCQSQIMLTGAGGLEQVAQRILKLSPGDLVIAMALPRYSQATIDFLKLARGRGAHCVAVTDGPQSPLAAISQEQVFVPATHPVLHSSTLGALAVFEALSAVLAAHHQSVSDAMSVTYSLMPYLYADTPQTEDLG